MTTTRVETTSFLKDFHYPICRFVSKLCRFFLDVSRTLHITRVRVSVWFAGDAHGVLLSCLVLASVAVTCGTIASLRLRGSGGRLVAL